MSTMWNKATDVDSWLTTVRALSAALAMLLAASQASADNKQQVREIIIKEADKHGIDRNLLLAIASVESGFNPSAVGTLDDRGLFQLRQKFFGADASFDPKRNARAAAAYLAWLRRRPSCNRYGKYWYVCFNRGPSADPLTDVSKFEYARKVERAVARMEASANDRHRNRPNIGRQFASWD